MLGDLFQLKSGDVTLLFNGIPLDGLLAIVSLVLLVITIIISTRSLRQSTRSNILNSAPILLLKYNESSDSESGILVENIGQTAAVNIRIENVYGNTISFSDSRKAVLIKSVLKFTPLDILLPGVSERLDTSNSKQNDAIIDLPLIESMMNAQTKLNIKIKVF